MVTRGNSTDVAIDLLIVDEVGRRLFAYRSILANVPGGIDSQADVGGYPVLKNGPAPADFDHDGLPDWWELRHGLNPQSAQDDYSDTNADPDANGYTHMDEYLEYLAQGGYPLEAFSCTEGIDADLNGDCKVSLEDFEMFAGSWPVGGNLQGLAQLASQWLECNREPAVECR